MTGSLITIPKLFCLGGFLNGVRPAACLYIVFIMSGPLLYLILPPDAWAEKWSSVPIRSANQIQAGLLGGEGFQMVMDVSYAPSEPSIVYFAVDTSRIWKSADGGETWQFKSRGINTMGVRSIIVDPKNPNIVFAAGFGGHSVSMSYPNALSGIFRTTDGGETWTLVRETQFFKQTRGRLFAFNSASGDAAKCTVIFAGSYNEGLLQSIDGGHSWNATGLKGKHILDIEEIPSLPGHLLIATEEGLYKYTPDSIVAIGTGLPGYPRALAIHHQDPKIVYAAVGWHRVYKSTDSGNSFKSINQGLPASVNCTNIASSPADSNIIYVSFGESGIPNPYYSTDGGATWKAPITVDDGSLFHIDNSGCWYTAPIASHPLNAEEALAVVNGANIVIKTLSHGKRWRYSNTGYTGGVLGGSTALSFASGGKMMFCLIDFGCWLTENGCETFKHLKVKEILGQESCTASAMHNDTIVVAIGTWGQQGIEVSWDGGVSWKVYDSLLDSYRFIAFHPQSPSVIYAGKYRSDDNGRSWKQLQEEVRAVYPGNGDMVYAVSSTGNGKALIEKSSDRGESWTTPYGISPFIGESTYEIAVSPKDPDRIYAGTASGVWIYNQGQWTQKGTGQGLERDSFGMNYVKSISIDSMNPHIIYAGKWAPGVGASNGIFRSVDNGNTWENITGNIGPELEVNSVAVSPTDGSVYLGTYRGTWKYRPSSLTYPSQPKNLRVRLDE
jgi:photosystem II stability/assembly factor-like uncharacterized protein